MHENPYSYHINYDNHINYDKLFLIRSKIFVFMELAKKLVLVISGKGLYIDKVLGQGYHKIKTTPN